MTITLGVVMDPIDSINIKKDSTFAMLLEAQRRGWGVRYMEQQDLYLDNDRACARVRTLLVEENPQEWFRFVGDETIPLDELDVILMRKDPPFDMDYIYSTYLLEKAEERGVLIVNHPASLRDCNEKLFTAWFPQCCTPTLVTSNRERILRFMEQQKDIILKPLDGMGGSSIFRIRQGDPNANVIIETLTSHGKRLSMAQRFVPEISQGDKRILMVDGEPVPYALARIPKPGETRGNLAAGGTGQGIPLSEQDRWIALQVGPSLRQRGILFAGLDVIGDYLTEINITSPTCIRELDSQFGLNISAQLMDRIEEKLAA
ncbi:glutathione synthase [Sedimenticola selenatireducens]|uniref:glutathione synthase n=1 Tax=Sedimenticola selenatireducens TaxID=191960 RepID=UPI00048B24DF|nr:glutathione synthase [Sedimenticola selenatireducens]